MHSCPKCKGKLTKYGFLKKLRTQRYRCNTCRKLCSDAPNRTFGTLRTKPETITLIVQLLAEGMSVRGTARIAKVHRDTVLRVLKHAGTRAQRLLEKKLVDVPVKDIQADEIHTTVFKKSIPGTDPELDTNPWGDFYIFLALERNTKLLMMPTIGKRSTTYTEWFANDLNKSTTGRFQITTDGFRPYKNEIKKALGNRVDFAQYYKEYNMLQALKKNRIPNPNHKDSTNHHVVRCGSPTLKNINTSHVERVNLSLRTFNKRFNRRTICYSKAEEYLAYSVYLFVAHYNFVRPHSTLGRKTTPAMAQKLADKPWTLTELLAV